MLVRAPAEIITLLKLGFSVLGKNRYVLPTKCHRYTHAMHTISMHRRSRQGRRSRLFSIEEVDYFK